MEEIIGYSAFENALENIAEDIDSCKFSNYRFYEDRTDSSLEAYIKTVKDLTKSYAKFHNLFEDFMMEFEVADFEKWEDEQIKYEKEYYTEGVAYEGDNQ